MLPVDVAFVMDATGSMGDEIQQLKDVVFSIHSRLRHASDAAGGTVRAGDLPRQGGRRSPACGAVHRERGLVRDRALCRGGIRRWRLSGGPGVRSRGGAEQARVAR